eukprot:TRINITY_DN5868_c0_g1_i14.p1 TRINITY_DN5868_c0_g1~~TRINITY_DN5868_c0_g1_i14.p1  ORF type:complete len:138 (+),score=5.81 TRINITY_DN5868_c0_g1_i14:274-687(+)
MHTTVMTSLCLNYAFTKLSPAFHRLIFYLYAIVECVLLLAVQLSHYCASRGIGQFRLATIAICFIQVVNLLVSYDVKASESFLLIMILVLSVLCTCVYKRSVCSHGVPCDERDAECFPAFCVQGRRWTASRSQQTLP